MRSKSLSILNESLSLSLCSHIICACNTLKLILKSFSSVIVTNIKQPNTPTNGGIDIAREERSVNISSQFISMHKKYKTLYLQSQLATTINFISHILEMAPLQVHYKHISLLLV